MPPLGKRKESARVLVRPWFGETNPYWHDPISPPQLAEEVYDYCERLVSRLIALSVLSSISSHDMMFSAIASWRRNYRDVEDGCGALLRLWYV